MDLRRSTNLFLLFLVMSGRIGRVTVSLNSGAELADHILGLEDEPHHVCVTGNQGAQAVDTYVLQGTDQSRSDLHLSSLISQESCTVQQARMGNTLFTISEDLSDQCSARLKTNSLTCDVLFHAHSGSDADELYKFRLMAENFDCNAQMIVVHDSPDMETNFNAKMHEHAKLFPGQGCTQSPLWINAQSDSPSKDVIQ